MILTRATQKIVVSWHVARNQTRSGKVVDTFADARQNDVQNLAEEMEDET